MSRTWIQHLNLLQRLGRSLQLGINVNNDIKYMQKLWRPPLDKIICLPSLILNLIFALFRLLSSFKFWFCLKFFNLHWKLALGLQITSSNKYFWFQFWFQLWTLFGHICTNKILILLLISSFDFPFWILGSANNFTIK